MLDEASMTRQQLRYKRADVVSVLDDIGPPVCLLA